jgi:integrase
MFEPESPAASWSERSRTKTARGYGRWLSWLFGKELLDLEQSPDDRVTEPRVKTYIVDLVGTSNGGYTVVCRIQELYDAIRVMAPDRDWSWLRRIQNALRARAVPVRDKRARMQPAGELSKLGRALMQSAETALDKPLLARAVRYRDGMMIALLAHRPLRGANFGAITLGVHLIPQRHEYALSFRAEEVKSRRPIITAVPATLVPALTRYIEYYRPLLLTRGGRQDPASCDALWVSETGVALNPLSIPNRIKKHTKAAFGKHICPHLFRDCVATTIAIDDPTHVRGIISILGHSTLAISEKHYNQARGLDASRRYQQVIAELESSLAENGV